MQKPSSQRSRSNGLLLESNWLEPARKWISRKGRPSQTFHLALSCFSFSLRLVAFVPVLSLVRNDDLEWLASMSLFVFLFFFSIRWAGSNSQPCHLDGWRRPWDRLRICVEPLPPCLAMLRRRLAGPGLGARDSGALGFPAGSLGKGHQCPFRSTHNS